MTFRIDDILAAVLLSIIMLRRLEVLGTTVEDNPQVSREDFARWHKQALSVHNFAAVACVAKVLLSVAWFYLLSAHPLALRLGGLAIFIGWTIALVFAWRRATEARALQGRLGIVNRQRKV